MSLATLRSIRSIKNTFALVANIAKPLERRGTESFGAVAALLPMDSRLFRSVRAGVVSCQPSGQPHQPQGSRKTYWWTSAFVLEKVPL
jgi:hypothetical protein